ncbi:MAG TPA: HAD family hydrolase [Syntrophorhabdales bacterium]|nr:HAD family hydrolase [Syntrophorhabdales bacterium]
MIRAAIFDFDGTLIELTLDFSDLRRHVERLALTYVPQAFIRGLDSLYMLEMIDEVEKKLGAPGADFRHEAYTILRGLEVRAAQGKAVYSYTREVLAVLRGKGVKIGVMTRNCAQAVRTVFPDMDAYVDAMVTREDVRPVKPHPAHVSAVLELLGGVDPVEAILVGDHPTDIFAGIAAGTTTVGVLTGRTERADFEKAGAAFVVRDIRDVPALIG